MSNKPKSITRAEWAQLAKVPELREAWGIDGERDEESFGDSVFGAKFDYVSDGPGYAGELYVLLGGAPECAPFIILRREGKLVIVTGE